jgi:hypothetical protein
MACGSISTSKDQFARNRNTITVLSGVCPHKSYNSTGEPIWERLSVPATRVLLIPRTVLSGRRLALWMPEHQVEVAF